MSLERFLTYGLALLLLAAPLPFGSVEPGPASLLTASCLILGALWTVWRSCRGLPALPWREPILKAGALFALIGLVQLIPLPRAVLQTISPKAVELRDRYEPRRAETPAPAASPEAASSPTQQSGFAGAALAVGGGAAAGWRPISLYPWATRQSVLRFLACLVVVLMVAGLATRESQRRVLVTALVASGGFQAVYGLYEYFGNHQHIFGYAKKYYTDVATGTFINRNHFAGYLAMTLPLAIALAVSGFSRTRANHGHSLAQRTAGAEGRGLFSGAILLVIALTMTIALACSRSRMGIASMLVALLSVGVLIVWRGHGRNFVASAIVVTAVALLLLSQGDSAPLLVRFLHAARELHSDIGRGAIWQQAAGVVAHFPLLGAGFGVFPYLFPVFRTRGEGIALAHAHSDYLELAAEVGLVGVLVGVLGAILAGRPYWRGSTTGHLDLVSYAAGTGIIAIAIHGITDFNTAIPASAVTLSALAGLLAVRLRGPVATVVLAGSAPSRVLRACASAGVLVILAVISLASLGGAMVFAATPSGSNEMDESTPGDALRPARLVSGDAERWFDLARRIGDESVRDLRILIEEEDRTAAGSAQYLERRLTAAIALQSEGLWRLPVSASAHVDLSRLMLARCAARSLGGTSGEDCLEEAMPELRRALALNPMSAAIHRRAARMLLMNWDLLNGPLRVDAEQIIERALTLNPRDPELQEAWAVVRPARAPNS